MNRHVTLLCVVSCFIALCAPSYGANWFEGLLQGAKCFGQGERSDTCPEGNLNTNCEVDWERQGVNEPETFMFLFTPDCQDDQPEFIHDCGGQLAADTTFNPTLQTIMIVHGWIDGVCRSAWMREYKEEFLRRGPHNVILVDWSWGSSFDPSLAMDNAVVVAQQIAYVVKNMITLNGLNPNYLHIIGHNYGGHLAGMAGRYINAQNGARVGRITGLDPGFPDRELDYRLDPTDANFVDVVHTSGGFCPFSILDEKYDIGHAEYFVNGGQTFAQFACVPYIIVSALKWDPYYGFISLTPWTCANLQAIQYFKSTIVPEDNPMVAVECTCWDEFSGGSCKSCGEDGSQCSIFGYDSPLTFTTLTDVPRKFYLETNLFCPYVKNDGIDFGGFPFADFIEHGEGGAGGGGGGGGCFLTQILNMTMNVVSGVLGGIGGGPVAGILGGLGGGAEGGGAISGVVGGVLGGAGGGDIVGGLTGGITGGILGGGGGGGGGGAGGLTGGITGGLTGGLGGGLLGGGGGGGKGKGKGGKGKKKGGGGFLLG